jgi:transcriptional regulator with XRE-family HTH domain
MKYTDYLQEIESDSEYRQAKAALQAHFALGDAVLRARVQRGWTQAELALKIGTKQANISRIEAGLGNPTLKLIQKIVQVLDLEINFAPAPSSTSSKVIPFAELSIPVPNWPVSQQGTWSQSQIQVGGERR